MKKEIRIKKLLKIFIIAISVFSNLSYQKERNIKTNLKIKKCPVCNSSRVTQSKNGFECKRCGYVNKEVKEKTFA